MGALRELRVTIVGAGRLGTALADALRGAGVTVAGPLRRGERVGDADIVLFCVPDREIARAAAAVAVPAGTLVGHCSGALGPSELAPREAFVFHPLMTVTEDGAALAGAAAAVSGSTARALETSRELALTLGMEPVTVLDEHRGVYHAAASLASNYLVTLESAAELLAARAGAGIERRHILPLARAALENWGRCGSAALTGPVARGDEDTVAAQRSAVATEAPALLPMWDALTEATRRLATAAPRETHGAPGPQGV
jgi:predicted short-subunit dehydrogenase-like oxidoreductase (DUF2520 family)